MSILAELKCHKIRALKTLLLYLVLVACGMNSSLPGVTLLDLQILVDVTLDKITLIVPASSAGFIVGAIACGILMEFIDFQIILMISVFLCSAGMAYIPWNQTYLSLMTNSVINGILIGFVNTGGNTWMLHVWGTQSPPFIQAYHFSFGVGAFIAPLVAEPFLVPLEEDSNSTHFTKDDLKIKYPYSITALFVFMVITTYLVIYLWRREVKSHPSVRDESVANRTPVRASIRYSLIVITCMFMFFYYGLELFFGQLLATYVVNCELRLSKSVASYMTSFYWATFTFCRCFVIVVVNYLSSEMLLIIDLAVVLLANVFLLPFGNNVEWCLWVGIALMGFGTSPMFAAVFGFLQDFMNISSKVASLFFVSCCLGTFILPYIIGNYITIYPQLFLYLTCVCSVMLCISFLILMFLKRYHLKSCISKRSNVDLAKF